MEISFDLDSTLIPHGNEFESENRSWFAKFIGIEEVRKGTKKLIDELKHQGHNIHIYTTSYRAKWRIRTTLLYHGIRVNQIITQAKNERVLKSHGIHASKYPSLFSFDLHIDDSKGVEIEAKRLNFNVIIVDPLDTDWSEKIKKAIKMIL